MNPLTADQVVRHCDPALLGFASSADAPGHTGVVAQERALEALRFGIAMARHHEHVFAHGPNGSGRHSIVLDELRRAAAERPAASDWCYVYNFEHPRRPRVLRLPPGRGSSLRTRMNELTRELTSVLPGTFDSDEYRTRRLGLEEEWKQERETQLTPLEERASAAGIAIVRTPLGFALAAVRGGRILESEEFERLPEAERTRVRAVMQAIEADLKALLASIPARERAHRHRLTELNREFARRALTHLIDEVRDDVRDLPDVLAHLDAVEADLVANAEDLVEGRSDASHAGASAVDAAAVLQRCLVNLLVEHPSDAGAPVVYEDMPTQPDLAGRIEHVARFGALVTDFTLIKAGALHRANGGYLVLDARRLLLQPLAWDELKRSLRARELRYDGVAGALPWLQTATLEPEPVPLDVMVVLIGTWDEYELLAAWDPDFTELFKTEADFVESIERTPAAERELASLLASLARHDGLRPFTADALAATVDHAARLAEHAGRLAMTVGALSDVLREADVAAAERGADSADRADVAAAISRRTRRAGRIAEERRRAIREGLVRVDLDGRATGQVNGLSVVSLPDITLGWPSRLTAQVRVGDGEVVDIEREVRLGGPIHSKGVLILEGYLGGTFGRHMPLSLHASLVFEQSYGGVEGDSASLAELCALLSAIGDLPVRQSLAVTGSVDQHGKVQAVGAVNAKVEGFFDVCRDAGLTGTQGVLIPAANVQTLMLRDDVVEAVRTGQFEIHPVATVGEALELLTGMQPGEPDEHGHSPEDTVLGQVEAHLRAFTDQAREIGQGERPGPRARSKR
jgi:predicted ATP-dependent protease